MTNKLEIVEVERGKPHERETQILVGELKRRNKTEFRKAFALDKCLSPLFEEQNMAYKILFFYLRKEVANERNRRSFKRAT